MKADKKSWRESDSDISHEQDHQNSAHNIQYSKILKSEWTVLAFNATFYNMVRISEINLLLDIKILKEIKRNRG